MNDALHDQRNEPRTGLRLRVVPLLVTVVLAFAIPYAASACAYMLSKVAGTPGPEGALLPFLYVHHALQGLFGWLAIVVMRRFVPADYGLHRPTGNSYLAPAISWGLAFGVLMTLVDYAPELWSRTVPHLDYPLNTANVTGWLFFEGVFVGPTEEIPFRALLVTYLAAQMPGLIRVRRFSMSWAGVIVAVIFALLHANNFSTRDWPQAIGQQIYAFILGVLYAYWLEQSRSVLAPAIGHNVGDVTEFVLLFAWVALAS
jgi:membrane protease YdiL (CAAX protease family)